MRALSLSLARFIYMPPLPGGGQFGRDRARPRSILAECLARVGWPRLALLCVRLSTACHVS